MADSWMGSLRISNTWTECLSDRNEGGKTLTAFIPTYPRVIVEGESEPSLRFFSIFLEA
jgi:hypothetical protein